MWLKEEIQKRGLKQKFIANEVCISTTYLSLLVNGHRTLKKGSALEKNLRRVITGKAA